jgi:hypothetical protein
MCIGKVRWNGNCFRAQEHEHPEQKIEQQSRGDEDADVQPRLCPPYRQRSSDVTSEHSATLRSEAWR